MDCIFCELSNSSDVIFDNELAFAMLDNHPVCKGHCLIIPKRHVVTYFDLSNEEISAMLDLSKQVKQFLDKKYHPDGYNVGFNCLEAGGQSVMHAHMHIIPRYLGDVPHPRGGIRKVISHK